MTHPNDFCWLCCSYTSERQVKANRDPNMIAVYTVLRACMSGHFALDSYSHSIKQNTRHAKWHAVKSLVK